MKLSKKKIQVSHYDTFDTHTDLMKQDLFHMATRLGANVVALYRTHPDTHMEYLIVVDTSTGDSVELNFPKRISSTISNSSEQT